MCEEVTNWKEALCRDFEQWLAELDEPPAAGDAAGGGEEVPDLHSFYAQLAVMNAENRKANRRTAEVISQWTDTLVRFESGLAPLRESVGRLAAAQPAGERLARGHCLVLLELLDRLQRLASAFAAPPPQRAWWPLSDAGWRRAWETQRGGIAIVVGHLQEFLAREGITRIEVLDRPFDPTVMTAVATAGDASRPPQTVVEEIAPGYHRLSELLRPAQVKVTRHE